MLVDIVTIFPGFFASPLATGLLEYPQYTRPAVYRGLEVPAVLRSGDHGAVERWRREQALERTRRLRPDLLEETGDATGEQQG